MPSALQSTSLSQIEKCAGCGANLEPGSSTCAYCGVRCSGAMAKASSNGAHRAMGVIVVAIGFALGAALIFLNTHSPTPVEPAVPAVYITPASPPLSFQAPIAEPPPAEAAPPRLVVHPSTQVVELPKEVHLMHLRTQSLGSATGGSPFEIKGAGREPIIGFQASSAQWLGKSVIRNLVPIYGSDHRVITRSMIVARPGYAVGGVIVDGDEQVGAIRIVFMPLEKNGLSLKNAYTSDWVGEPSGDTTFMLGGRGEMVTGIYGRKGLNVDALGLILLGQASEQ